MIPIPKVPNPVKSVLKDTMHTMSAAQLPLVASSLAYTTILSIIPVLAMSFSIFKAFGGMEKLYERIEPYILNNLAEGASDQAMEMIRGFIGNIHAGALGAGGLVGVIVTCMSMLFSIEKAINRIWGTQIQRSVFYRVSSYWLVITLGPLALSMAIGFATTQSLPLTQFLPDQTGAFAIAILIFLFIYKAVPNRKVHWWPAIISASVAAVAWNLARIGYAYYTSKVLTYNKIYGSLGAIPILLLWIYIAWLIVLGGAALTAGIQKKYDFK